MIPGALVDRELGQRGTLYDWVKLAWDQVESAPFVPGWHLEAMAEHLEAVSRLEIRKLLINVPPGSTKSLLTGVFWPTWEWLRRPGTRWIYASFDRALVGGRDGGKVLRLMGSEWWQARYPTLLESTVASAYDFDIKGGGFRFSTSPGGKGTGRHGHIVVIDDPIKPKDTMGGAAVTHKLIQRVSEWYSGTMTMRRADPATHREVIVMQRLHKDDLAGEAMRASGWTVLRLPMRFEKTYSVPGDRRTEDGALLWPERFPEITVQEIERAYGPDNSAAQLQQRPHVKGGKYFRRALWRFWGEGSQPCVCDTCFDSGISGHDTKIPCEPLPERGYDLLSWDMAFKGKATSDFVAGGAWRSYGGKFYLRDIVNARLDFAASKVAVLKMAIAYPEAMRVLIEDAANGPAIESELRQDLGTIELVRPEGGKEARAAATGPLWSSGVVYLPAGHPLVYALMGQLEAFPADLNDDMVDMVTQALVWYRAHGATTLFDQAMTNAAQAMRSGGSL